MMFKSILYMGSTCIMPASLSHTFFLADLMRRCVMWMNTRHLLLLTIAIFGLSGTLSVPATADQSQQTIDVNMASLANQQNPDGSWPASPDSVVTTAMAVRALIQHAVDLESGPGLPSPFDPSYPFREHVERGLDYLIVPGQSVDIASQPAGDPDTNGNNRGICFNCGMPDETYTTSMALMTVCNAVGYDRVVPSGPLTGMTYEAVAQDIIDYLSFGQVDQDRPNQGSWGSQANSPDDAGAFHTSTVAMALQYAEISRPDGCGLTVPEFVNNELNSWVENYSSKTVSLGTATTQALAVVPRAASSSFRDYWKECPGGWKDSGYPGEQPPLCFQMTKNYDFDIPLAYFSSQLFDYENLPVTPDPRNLAIYWRNNNRGDKMLEYAETNVPPSGQEIDLDTASEKKFFVLESNGILKIKKGYRWDGPTTKPVARPDDYQDVLMNASLVHDVIYDLMRMGKIDREDTLIPPIFWWNHDGFRNRLLADNIFYMIAIKDADARAEFWWATVRFGGWAKTKQSMPDWKSHALADAGQYSNVQCASPEGTNVSLDGTRSRFAESWTWSWQEGGQEKTASGATPLPQFFGPGTHTVTLKVDCLPGSPDCHEHYMDTDVATITITPDSVPPLIAKPVNITVNNEPGQCSAHVNFEVTATDNCGEPMINCSHTSGDLFPGGDTDVLCTAEDVAGLTDSTGFTVTVLDAEAPDITAAADIVAECSSSNGTPVVLPKATASDNCDITPDINNNAPSLFPLGKTVVTWTATDDDGNSSTDTQDVTIVDTTPPSFSLSVSPTDLWPPNHKLVTVVPTTETTDICDHDPVVTLISITSNEPDNDIGGGNTSNDIVVIDDFNFKLRAERSGKGTGREYTITYQADDASGNIASASTVVSVAHNR